MKMILKLFALPVQILIKVSVLSETFLPMFPLMLSVCCSWSLPVVVSSVSFRANGRSWQFWSVWELPYSWFCSSWSGSWSRQRPGAFDWESLFGRNKIEKLKRLGYVIYSGVSIGGSSF